MLWARNQLNAMMLAVCTTATADPITRSDRAAVAVRSSRGSSGFSARPPESGRA